MSAKRIVISPSKKTFSNQNLLPCLPIPDLQSTSKGYKRSLLPLLSATEYETAEKKIDRFFQPDGLADKLQQRLHVIDERETAKGSNWLNEIWMKWDYLGNRMPTFVYTNYWLQFRNPPNGLEKQAKEGEITEFQIRRSAGLIAGLVDYSKAINNEEIPPDVTRSGPLCMNQLKNLFGTSRIAASGCDKPFNQWPCLSKFINVIYKDQIFDVQVIADHGETCSVNALRRQLWQVVQQVEETSIEQRQINVGQMTTEHRDVWGPIREEMQKQAINVKTLESIDTSLFVVCLDNYSSPLDTEGPILNFYHGKNGRNRWFDKGLQFIIENNGCAGMNGEHTSADGVISIHVIEDVLSREPIKDIISPVEDNFSLQVPKLLRWEVTDSLKQSIKTAEIKAAELVSEVDAVVLSYEGYGSDKMKEANVSPDGWLQMAYMLAYYRHYGKSCPVYGTAALRKYRAGRLEIIRSCSVETVAFTKAWEDKNTNMSEKLRLFKKAVVRQKEDTRAANNGYGIDRHLLGLFCQMTAEEAKSEDAVMFQDPSYEKSQHWNVCVSNTSPGDYILAGFAPVVYDGYGSNYAIGKNRIRMSITTFKSCKETDAGAFKKTIESVLDELGDVADKYLIQESNNNNFSRL